MVGGGGVLRQRACLNCVVPPALHGPASKRQCDELCDCGSVTTPSEDTYTHTRQRQPDVWHDAALWRPRVRALVAVVEAERHEGGVGVGCSTHECERRVHGRCADTSLPQD